MLCAQSTLRAGLEKTVDTQPLKAVGRDPQRSSSNSSPNRAVILDRLMPAR